jgi:hypothetical protein
LWDHHLRTGRRIIGVGGIDSHDPRGGLHQLGQLTTWIYAPMLSEQGLLEGLRTGRVYVSRDTQLGFSATGGGAESVEMGGVLSVRRGDSIEMRIRVKGDVGPLTVHLLKNGYPFEAAAMDTLGQSWEAATFSDTPQRSGYYRVEVHTVSEQSVYKGIAWRDHLTMQAMSNPIWVDVR